MFKSNLMVVLVVVCVSWQRRFADAQECVCTCTTTPSAVVTTPVVAQTTTVVVEPTTPIVVETTSEPLISSTPSCSSAPCDEINDQIVVDADNETFITTAINEAYATWNITEQNTFLGYKKRIETIIYKGTTSTDSEEEQIAKVVSGFTTNPERAAQVYDIQIACWGTIRQFVECVNSIYGTSYKIW